MQFKLYTDVHDFYEAVYSILMRHEAQNLIPLGNIILGHDGKDKTDWRDPINWVMATVSDESGICLTALMTPPHNLTLYATDNLIDQEAIQCLIEGLADYPIPGVMSEKSLAEAFAKAYVSRRSMTYHVAQDQRIYELDAVNPDVPQFGHMRLMDEGDMHFFPFWLEAFSTAAQYGRTEMRIPQDDDLYQYRLDSKKLYVLEVDGQAVSMAGFSREMEHVVGVAFVYTPVYFRGKGYASSCVAQLSQLGLDRGYGRCALYTDLMNPTSNSIYQKIGYQAVCDSLMLRFEEIN